VSDPTLLRTLTFAPTEDMRIDLVGPLACRCPVNGLEDRAMVRVRYAPSHAIVELGSFKAYLDSFAEQAITHEAATEAIQCALGDLLAPDSLEAETVWAPVEGITCSVRTLVR
jgi:7-cyano-7-deazaguanine reductase